MFTCVHIIVHNSADLFSHLISRQFLKFSCNLLYIYCRLQAGDSSKFVVRSFVRSIFAGRGPAYSGPQRLPRESKELVGVCDVC